MARLPQSLMSHASGSALAIIAHIDRVWSMTFEQAEHEAHVAGFQALMEHIMAGDRVGHAVDRFNHRWARLSEALARSLKAHKADAVELKRQWLARENARNFVLYGDPAVRLRIGHMPVLG